eukprot:180089-Amphidinium_carterae.1
MEGLRKRTRRKLTILYKVWTGAAVREGALFLLQLLVVGIGWGCPLGLGGRNLLKNVLACHVSSLSMYLTRTEVPAIPGIWVLSVSAVPAGGVIDHRFSHGSN